MFASIIEANFVRECIGWSAPVIPTALKAKLPKVHSFPIGAQAISNALEGVPQFDNLQLWFSRHSRSDLVLAVRYAVPENTLSTPRFLSATRHSLPRWDIYVYAVSRELKSEISEHIQGAGLQAIRNWLTAERTETWLQVPQRFELHYDSNLRQFV